jgi:alpha-tubulin suppressor-like RCC1 family protein
MSWTTVSAGFGFSLGISDGKLYAWGSNDNGIGELGLGDTSPRSTPTQVGVATDWTVCSAGAEGTAAGISGGKLYTWGKNLYGQLGLGDIDARSTPTQVGVATTWQEIECSKGGMLGLLA